MKVGSGNAAHLNQFLCVPRARFLGVTPQDIWTTVWKTPHIRSSKPTSNVREDAISNDPFFARHPQWVAAIEQLLSMGVRAEQQALAKWGLNYVIDDYLPKKLATPESFLP